MSRFPENSSSRRESDRRTTDTDPSSHIQPLRLDQIMRGSLEQYGGSSNNLSLQEMHHIEAMEEKEADKKRMNNAGQLLGLTLSNPDEWSSFSAAILLKCDETHIRLLGDILRGKEISEADLEMHSNTYMNLTAWVRTKWERRYVDAINEKIREAECSMKALFGDKPPEDNEIRKILDKWNEAEKSTIKEEERTKIIEVCELLERLGVSDLRKFNKLRKEGQSLERDLSIAEKDLRALGGDPHPSRAPSQSTQGGEQGVRHRRTSELPGDSRSASPGPEQGVASRGKGLERDTHLKEVQSDREMQERNTGRIPERIRKKEEVIGKRKMEIDRVKKDIAGLFKKTPEPETMQEILDRLDKVDRMREINLENDEDLKAQISDENKEAERLLASHIADGDFDPQKFGSLRKDYKGLKEKLDSDERDLRELHEILVDLPESDGGSFESFLGKSPLREESKAVVGRDVGVPGLKAYDTPDENNNCAIYAMLGAAGFDMQSPEAGEVARRTKLSLASDGKVWSRNKMLEFKGSETGTGVDAFLKLREAGIIPEGRGLRVYTEYGNRDYISGNPGKEPICIYLNSKKMHFEALKPTSELPSKSSQSQSRTASHSSEWITLPSEALSQTPRFIPGKPFTAEPDSSAGIDKSSSRPPHHSTQDSDITIVAGETWGSRENTLRPELGKNQIKGLELQGVSETSQKEVQVDDEYIQKVSERFPDLEEEAETQPKLSFQGRTASPGPESRKAIEGPATIGSPDPPSQGIHRQSEIRSPSSTSDYRGLRGPRKSSKKPVAKGGPRPMPSMTEPSPSNAELPSAYVQPRHSRTAPEPGSNASPLQGREQIEQLPEASQTTSQSRAASPQPGLENSSSDTTIRPPVGGNTDQFAGRRYYRDPFEDPFEGNIEGPFVQSPDTHTEYADTTSGQQARPQTWSEWRENLTRRARSAWEVLQPPTAESLQSRLESSSSDTTIRPPDQVRPQEAHRLSSTQFPSPSPEGYRDPYAASPQRTDTGDVYTGLPSTSGPQGPHQQRSNTLPGRWGGHAKTLWGMLKGKTL